MGRINLVVQLMIITLAIGLFGAGGGPSDEQIVNDSLARLKMDSRVDAVDIRVQSKNRIVTLTGHVPTVNQKYLAEAIVGSTRIGIREIVNEINVITPAVEDQKIAGDIRDGIDKEPMLRGTGIKVEVIKGVVYLTGTVRTAEQKRLAMVIATRPAGVVDMVSNLDIVPEKLPDSEIVKEVNNYLRVSPLVKEDQVRVSVQDGVVHLSGEVDQLMSKVMLIEIIGHIRGVVAVKSEIRVK